MPEIWKQRKMTIMWKRDNGEVKLACGARTPVTESMDHSAARCEEQFDYRLFLCS
jgi:hypothetical protein